MDAWFYISVPIKAFPLSISVHKTSQIFSTFQKQIHLWAQMPQNNGLHHITEQPQNNSVWFDIVHLSESLTNLLRLTSTEAIMLYKILPLWWFFCLTAAPYPLGAPLVAAMEGSNITLTCSESKSLPPAKTTWKRGIEQVPIVPSSKYIVVEEGPQLSLTIVNATKEDQGVYFCWSENALAYKALEVYLTIRRKWSFRCSNWNV